MCTLNFRKTRHEERRERMKIQLEKQKTENDAKQLERNRELVLKVIVSFHESCLLLCPAFEFINI